MVNYEDYFQLTVAIDNDEHMWICMSKKDNSYHKTQVRIPSVLSDGESAIPQP